MAEVSTSHESSDQVSPGVFSTRGQSDVLLGCCTHTHSLCCSGSKLVYRRTHTYVPLSKAPSCAFTVYFWLTSCIGRSFQQESEGDGAERSPRSTRTRKTIREERRSSADDRASTSSTVVDFLGSRLPDEQTMSHVCFLLIPQML